MVQSVVLELSAKYLVMFSMGEARKVVEVI